MTPKFLIIIAGISGAMAVVLGAFGAHGLKPRIEPQQLEAFETAVRYHFIHTLALLAVAILLDKAASSWLAWSGLAFVAGIVLFSGSLYLLSCKSLLHIEGWTWLGPVTPLGGLLFVAGWVLLALGFALKG